MNRIGWGILPYKGIDRFIRYTDHMYSPLIETDRPIKNYLCSKGNHMDAKSYLGV